MGGKRWLLASFFLASACNQDPTVARPAFGPLQLDFGTVNVGGQFFGELEVKNPSSRDGTVVVDEVDLPFTLLNNEVPIRAGRSIKLHFLYKPREQGTNRVVTSVRLPGALRQIVLMGKVGPQPVQCDPPNSVIEFGTVPGHGAFTRPFHCTNSSDREVVLSAVTTESTGRTDVFDVSRSTITLEPGVPTLAAAWLYPRDFGEVSGNLDLTDESGAINVPIALHATVAESWLEVWLDGPDGPVSYDDPFAPVPVVFENAALGKSATTNVHVRNNGPDPVTLRLLLTPDLPPGIDAVPDSFVAVVPPVLGHGEEQVIPVSFTPSVNGPTGGTFVIKTGDLGREYIDLAVSGWGGGPTLSCSPDTVDFGLWAVGYARDMTVRCSSNGTDDPSTTLDDLRVDTIDASGDFTVDSRTVPATVPGGSSFDLRVTFKPTLTGVRSGALQLGSSGGPASVALVGEAFDTTGCDPEIDPRAGLEFRRVPPGTRATLEASVVNHGTGTCVVRDVAVAAGSSPVFSTSAPDGAVVEPGQTVDLPVSVDPGAVTGPASGTLTLWVQAARALSLTATVEAGCLRVSPSPLDLGRAPLGCRTMPVALSIYDDCQDPVNVTSMDLAPGTSPAFIFQGAPGLPFTVPAGGSVGLAMYYAPTRAGADAGGLLLTTDSGADPLFAPVLAEGLADGSPVDRFDTHPTADVLVVVDDRPNTAAQNGFSDFANTLVSDLEAHRVAYHLGVTGTSTVACDDPANPTPDGRLLPVGSNTRIVTSGGTRSAVVLGDNMSAAVCSGTNTGLEAAYRALHAPLLTAVDDLRHGEPNDGNANFLRFGAELSVVYFSADDDGSSRPVDYYMAHVTDATPAAVHLSAVAGSPEGCSQVSPAPRYRKMVQATGTFTSMCDPGWAVAAAHSVSGAIGKQQIVYPLSHRPPDATNDGVVDENDLSVTVDGVGLPPFDDSGRIWSYSSEGSTGSVVFANNRAPQIGSVVGVNYGVICN